MYMPKEPKDALSHTLNSLSHTMGLMDAFENGELTRHDELQRLVARIHSHLGLAKALERGRRETRALPDLSVAVCLRMVCARSGRLMPRLRRAHQESAARDRSVA